MFFKGLATADVKDNVIVIRVDYNVPVKDGKVTESTRIKESIETLEYLLKHGAKRIHILSHLGRPKGAFEEAYSLKPIIPVLEQLLGETVEFREDFSAGAGLIQLHENVRFYPGEKTNDAEFVASLYKNLSPDLFILDGFGVSHRAHASVVGLANHVPAYAGFLLEKEIKYLSPFLSETKKEGLTLIVGGAKIETKIGVLNHFTKTADNIILGGALSNTFLAARGYDVGQSLYEEDKLDIAREIRQNADIYHTGIHKPIDVVVADEYDAEETATIPVEDICGDMKVFDVGPHSIASFKEIIKHSKTVIWNGPVGCFERKPFENGTREILEYLAGLDNVQTIVGGGDTLSAIKKFNIDTSKFTHVSTGGGAMLEFLEGTMLPGIAIVQ